MELTIDNFQDSLLEILRQIAVADFVSFDFEFSGIKLSSYSHKTSIERMGDDVPEFDRRPSMQERYDELREMAKKYTILQVGITIAKQNLAVGGYEIRSYNVHLNPLIKKKLEISRDVTISSAAAEFLVKNHFDLNAPFSEGVLYLSRDEHLRAIQLESERLDSISVIDLDFNALDAQAQAFVHQVRDRLQRFKPSVPESFININGPAGPGNVMEMVHRRIIYQLVRSEFPEFVVIPIQFGMRIIKFDREHEQRRKADKIDTFFLQLSQQVGFRWIIDALSGGSLNDLSPEHIRTKQDPQWENRRDISERLNEVKAALKKHRPVMIGHNPFTDLVYLYTVFIGEPPRTVDKFAEIIHKMFPMVVDTKWLATHHGNMAASSLAELRREYSNQALPLIVPGKGFEETFSSYITHRPAHQAGFDSYATALIAVRSAAKLASCFDWRAKLDDKARALRISQISGGPNLPGFGSASTANGDPSKSKSKEDLLIDLSDEEGATTPISKPRTVRETAFRLRGIFTPQMLCEWRDDEMRPPEGSVEELLPKPVDPVNSDPDRWNLVDGIPRWMPNWNSDFWLVFGNKLRVNGTVENMIDLANPSAPLQTAPSSQNQAPGYVKPWNELFRGAK